MKKVILTFCLWLMVLTPAHASNYALDFGEFEDFKFVEVGRDSRFDTDEITIEAWIKPTSLPTGHYIYEGRSTIIWNGDQSGGHDPYIFYINEYGALEAHVDFVSGPPGIFIIDDTPVSLHEWHHVALVITPSKIELYLDGTRTTEVSHDRGPPDKNNSHVAIGRHRYYKNPFGGLMDEIRIWGVARTQQQINEYMYSELTGDEDGLVAYWSFYEGSGQTAHDLTSNQINGALGSGFEIDDYDPTWVLSDRPMQPPSQSVSIDIKPGIYPNTFNCNNENGVIDVAILTTDVFDATTVDHTTVTFEGASETHVNKKTEEPKRHEEDVDGDGDIDLLFHFRIGDTALTCESTEGTLTGETFDGTPIQGTDSITSEEPYACYEGVPKTGQTILYATGDDGDLERGVPWPDPRFTDHENGTVTDNLTGLMWLKDANCMATNYPEFDTGIGGDDIAGDGKVEWPRALEFVACMNDENCQDCNAGYTDWRLPNFKEIHSLMDYGNYDPTLNTGHPFIIQTGQNIWYWSSTSLPGLTSRVLRVNFGTGDVARNYKTERFYLVWPVRGGN